MRVLLCAVATLGLITSTALASDHFWSKLGTVVFLVVGNEGVGRTGPYEVFSPDHLKRIEVTFVQGTGDGDAVPVATLYVNERELTLPLYQDWSQVEVLWSPDSRNVAITGAFNSYTNSTKIFRLVAGDLMEMPLEYLQRDMANTYPPCKGQNADEAICHAEKHGDQFNYATVAWANANTAVIVAEIPCSSSQGGMMCQVEGYEIDIRSGHILRRMTARELKHRWQSKLAWNLRVPEAPYLKSTK